MQRPSFVCVRFTLTPFKIHVQMHCMFVLIAVFNWADDRFIHPNRIPVTICLGSATYSCTDTTRVRIGSLFAISLFVFRNMIIMLRHQYRLDAPILFGGMRTQRLLLIKSAVILNADESPESTATVEPESPPPGTALSHAATITETSNHSEEVPALSNGMRVLDIDDVPACESRPESAAACRDTDVSPGNPTSMLDSTSGPHVVSSPQSSSVDNALCSTSPNVLSLSMFSLFGIDVESRARAPRMLFGAAVSNLWRFSWFRGAAVSIFSTVLVLSFQNLPPNSLVVLCSLWTLVIIFSIVMLTLVDLRIVSELARTFEYWFLHMVNTVSFIAACSNLVNEADGAAAFIGNDRTLQLLNDICWNFIYFMGCALVVVADAVAIRRSLKIGLILFWISTLARVMWWRIWFTYQQPYMLPLDVCIWTECFSVQVIRLQASMTFILFSAKYVFSLFRFPRALVILKSTVVMGVVDDDTGRGVVADSDGDSDGASAPASGRSQSCIESGCDTVIAGTFPSDRTHASRRIPQ